MKPFLLFIFLILSLQVSAQQRITGKIIAATDSVPLPGATIKIQGTEQTTTTDHNGEFRLMVTAKSVVLEVSYVGYVPVSFPLNLPVKNPLMIRLTAKAGELKEVIISTGYQSLPRERATGSFTQVDNSLFNQQVTTNILARLETIAGGVTVDHTTSKAGRILIRGLSTINGPSQPLIVLDNFPYEGDPNNINPNDVESITILKDAAAASIWGTRAGNGVIVITTKKGHYNQALAIDLNANVTVGQKPDLNYLKPIATGDYINVEQQLFKQGFYDDYLNYAPYLAQTPVIELLNDARNGTITDDEAKAKIDSYRNLDVRNDFNRFMYKPAINQQYALNIRGGSAYSAWSVSGGYDRDLSSLGAGYDRINLRYQNSIKLTSGLTLNGCLYYTQSNNDSGRPGYGDIYQANSSLYPYAAFADSKGNSLPIAKDYSTSWLSLPANSGLLNWLYYPLEDYKHNRRHNGKQDLTGNVGINVQLIHGLSADIKYQYERQQTTGRNLMDMDSYDTRNLINIFTQVDPGTGAFSYPIPKGGILELSSVLLQTQNLRGQLNYQSAWGKHEINAIAGGEVRQVTTDGNADRLYGYRDDILTYSNVDYLTNYSLYGTGYPFTIPDQKNLTGLINRYQSYFANAAYTYDERYTLSASARRDASNLFGVHTNDKWRPLYSFGASWNLLKEAFIRLDWLSALKLRATYGISGNADQTRTAVTTISYNDTSPYTQTPYAVFSNYANPDLRWETAGIANFGLDFALQNNRLSGSLEYYHKNGKDLFGSTQIDYTTGIGATVIKNEAAMSGNGVDVVLHSLNTTGILKWTTDLNYSWYRDKVTKYYLPSPLSQSLIAYGISALEGKPVYSLFAFRSAGLNPQTGAPRGYLNGTISEDYSGLLNSDYTTLKFEGSLLPTHFGSLGNTLAYKYWSLTVRIAYKFGYYFRRRSIDYGSLYNYGNGNADYALRWQKPGDEQRTTVPSAIYPDDPNRDLFYNASTDLVEKGDHIRLQYITATWTLNKDNWHRNPFKSFQLYLSASNMGILWRANKHGIDPDYYATSNILPPAKSLALGIKINL